MCDGRSNNGTNAVARAVKQRDEALNPDTLKGIDFAGNVADITRQRQLPGARRFTPMQRGTVGSAFTMI